MRYNWFRSFRVQLQRALFPEKYWWKSYTTFLTLCIVMMMLCLPFG